MKQAILFSILLAFTACKPGPDNSQTKALDDLERGSYVAQSCRADAGATLSYDTSRIRAFGQNCGPNVAGITKTACDETIESIKTLPAKYQLLLNKVGMAFVIDTKANTQAVAQAAFKTDSVSIGNISSFWTASSSSKENYLATIVRVDGKQDIKKEISYSVLRTLGDFFARGVFSLSKNSSGTGFVFDPTVTSSLPMSYLEAQAGLTKRFLSQVQNKPSNKLLMSIADGDSALLNDFPVQISRNIKARNLASHVTTEALHQYYCNEKMRSEFKTGKYQDLAFDMNQILAAIDMAVSTHVNLRVSSQNAIQTSNQSLNLAGSSNFLASIMSFFQNYSTNQAMGSSAPNVGNTIDKIPASTSTSLADALSGCGCTSCGGNCTCSGGNCTCASGGCSCSSGGACTCAGGCSCGTA